MNAYSFIILSTFLLAYLLNFIGDFLNLKAMKTALPEEFTGVYDPESYRKSQEYTRICTQWGIRTSILTLAVTLGFWFSGGFNFLDRYVRQVGFGNLISGLIYIGSLAILGALLSLPLRIYETFVIEEKFGFNRTRPATFALDLLKGWFLALLLGGPLLAGILAFFEIAGPSAWLYGWIVATLFILFVQWIAPVWIMPMFNKFTPLESGELKESILTYARTVKFPIENVYVMDGSRRSTKGNAFFTGFGRQKKIALFDTLVEKQTAPELVAVLAHEIGHYKKKHVVQGMVISILNAGFLFFILSLFINRQGLYDAFYMDHPSIYAGLVFFFLLYSPVELILSVLFLILSRKNEFEADQFAAVTISEPENMVRALKKLAVDHLANLTPHPFYVFLNESHPPLMERIRAIRQAMKPALS